MAVVCKTTRACKKVKLCPHEVLALGAVAVVAVYAVVLTVL